MRRYLFFVWMALFAVACFMLYLMLEMQMTVSRDPNGEGGVVGVVGVASPIRNNELNNIETKIRRIEEDLQRNHQTIRDIKNALHDIVKGDGASLARLKKTFNEMDSVSIAPTRYVMPIDKRIGPSLQVTVQKPQENQSAPCLILQSRSKATVDMLDAYKEISFENVDGGVWKQGWQIKYDQKQWNPKKKLKVFLVPHSHNDPGWLKTFEDYFRLQTLHIFNNMISKLNQEPERRFIWAEVSYLSLWWKQAKDDQRQALKNLIASGQLEIVTGGWVMTDEANAHYYAMIDQLIEGHQWLKHYIGVKPKSAWAIDPFGHSPTMAYILKRSGFEHMLVQRIHYSVKKYLARRKGLEFKWRQSWDSTASTDMFCHMMPFYSYDVPHTCGPDPKICCQFDFKRLAGSKVNCPWKVPPQPITSVNVAIRAKMILDQWRKKSQLFRTNAVLVPLGDDFRYDKAIEWDQQYGNYKRLFDYMNAKEDWHVEAKFGTLSEYFAAAAEEEERQAAEHPNLETLPSISGDFFTYADRDDHYWSGYYTSKPFYKRLDRVVEANLRGAEILFSLANAVARRNKTAFPAWVDSFANLDYARKNLALFQHHDGVTGTSREPVTVDYGKKLMNALMKSKETMVASAQYLIANQLGIDGPPILWFDVDSVQSAHDSIPQATLIKFPLFGRSVPLILYNSLGHARQSVVRLRVTTPWIEVRDAAGSVTAAQVNLVWTSGQDSSMKEFELVFVATLQPLSLTAYTLRGFEVNTELPMTSFCEVTLYNSGGSAGVAKRGPFRVSRPASVEAFTVENGLMSAEFFGTTGLLKSVTLTETKDEEGVSVAVTKVNVNLEFVKYGTMNKKAKSGAYLFLPDGPATPIPISSPLIRVVKGRVLTEVHVILERLTHTIVVKNSPGFDGFGLEIKNLVDIRPERNFEIAMRLNTDVQNEDLDFFTDLNGFQVIRRRYFEKLPLQANFYPMPTMAFIEDSRVRLSVMSSQSLGVAALRKGSLEIVLDRRLAQDDERGLGQGVLDNKLTPNVFRLFVEKRSASSASAQTFPTLPAHLVSLETLHPVHAFPMKSSGLPTARPSSPLVNVTSPQFKSVSFLRSGSLPCDVHLLNLRTTREAPVGDADFNPAPGVEVVALLHRIGAECLPCSALSDGRVDLERLFSEHSVDDVRPISLTGIHPLDSKEKGHAIRPMEILSLLMKIK